MILELLSHIKDETRSETTKVGFWEEDSLESCCLSGSSPQLWGTSGEDYCQD